MTTALQTYTTADVAAMFGKSRQWVRDQVAAGRLRAMRTTTAANAPMLFELTDITDFKNSMRSITPTQHDDAPRSRRRRRRRI